MAALYRHPRQTTSIVAIVEGEKDVHTLEALNLRASDGSLIVPTTSGSSSSWRDPLADHFKTMKVVIMPDADNPGRRYAERIRRSLDARGIEHRTVSFEDVGAKDVTEFLEAGHTVQELINRVDWGLLQEEPPGWAERGIGDTILSSEPVNHGHSGSVTTAGQLAFA